MVEFYRGINKGGLKRISVLESECRLSFNCHCPWLPLCQPAKLVYSDASDYACGSFIHSEGKIFQQNWSPVERNNSSTWRELKAVELALISFAPSLLGKQVAWFTDNTNVVSIVHSGSKVTELQDLALHMFHVCVSSGILLELKWIPKDLNSFADHLPYLLVYKSTFYDQKISPKIRPRPIHVSYTKT